MHSIILLVVFLPIIIGLYKFGRHYGKTHHARRRAIRIEALQHG